MFVNAEVTISDPATGDTFKGQGKNLSGDGALFITDREFKIDQKLSLEISSEKSNLASLSADFEVKRVESLGDGKFEVAGIMVDVK
jgi:hypothetical protein